MVSSKVPTNFAALPSVEQNHKSSFQVCCNGSCLLVLWSTVSLTVSDPLCLSKTQRTPEYQETTAVTANYECGLEIFFNTSSKAMSAIFVVPVCYDLGIEATPSQSLGRHSTLEPPVTHLGSLIQIHVKLTAHESSPCRVIIMLLLFSQDCTSHKNDL